MIETTKTETAVVGRGGTVSPIKQGLMAMLVLLSVVAAVATASSSAEAHHSSYRGTVNVYVTKSYSVTVCLYSDSWVPVCGKAASGYIQFTVPYGHSYYLVISCRSNYGFLGTYGTNWFWVGSGSSVINQRGIC